MGIVGDVASGLAMAGKQGLSVLNSVVRKGQVIKHLEGVAANVGQTALGLRKGDWGVLSGAFKDAGSKAGMLTRGPFRSGMSKGFGGGGAFNSTNAKVGIAKEAFGNWWSGKSLSGISGAHTAQRAALRQTAVVGGGLMVGGSMIFGGRRHRRD